MTSTIVKLSITLVGSADAYAAANISREDPRCIVAQFDFIK